MRIDEIIGSNDLSIDNIKKRLSAGFESVNSVIIDIGNSNLNVNNNKQLEELLNYYKRTIMYSINAIYNSELDSIATAKKTTIIVSSLLKIGIRWPELLKLKDSLHIPDPTNQNQIYTQNKKFSYNSPNEKIQYIDQKLQEIESNPDVLLQVAQFIKNNSMSIENTPGLRDVLSKYGQFVYNAVDKIAREYLNNNPPDNLINLISVFQSSQSDWPILKCKNRINEIYFAKMRNKQSR